MTARYHSRPQIDDALLARLAYGLIALTSVAYAVWTVRLAASRPLWMDEVLAAWTARQPTFTAVWLALERGAEFSPPLFPWLLHGLVRLGAGSDLALRLPSIVAVYLAGWAVFVIARRRFSAPVAALTLTMVLASGMALFAIQARPYALVCACFAWALAVWDRPSERAPTPWSAVALAVLLALAVGLHFYAMIVVGAVGLMEAAWALVHRRIRRLHGIAIAAAIASILLWLPIMRQAATFNQGDASAAGYYARPEAVDLILSYGAVLVGHQGLLLTPLIILVSAVVLAAAPRARRGAQPDLDILIAVTCATPVLVFAFALVVTHTFNARYVIAAAVGFALLAARLIALLPRAGEVACAATVVLMAGMALPAADAVRADKRQAAIALVRLAPIGAPVVTGNGLRFFEMAEAGAAVIYLAAPPGTPTPDPTNAHQVMRWAAIDPRLAVAPAERFVQGGGSFLVFTEPGAADPLPSYLAVRGYRLQTVASAGGATLSRASAP